MPNQEHLRILRQGVEAWNRWRMENPGTLPDVSWANLREANLRRANLIGTNLIGADLRRVDLSGENLIGADLSGAKLRRADLGGADLSSADLQEADLRGADLRGADLSFADVNGTHLSGADLRDAIIGWGSFGNVDLSAVKGLETVHHRGPSTIGIDTIYRSQGNIPEVFLRGAGVPEHFITYMASLVGKPYEYYSCFISYSSRDHDFAERLHADLQSKAVRCWFAPEDMRIGDRIRPRIDEAIRLHDKLLLVLSENSIDSDWVETEVEAAFEKERQRKSTVLFPIRLDDEVMETPRAWAADIRRTRHIGDFRRWKDHDAYQESFDRLLRDLAPQDAEAAT